MAVDWGGLNNSFGIPSNDWNRMSTGDKLTWSSLVGANYPKIDPRDNPLGYFEGGYYDSWGNLLEVPGGGGGGGGVSSAGMGSVGAPNMGGGAGFVGSGYGYAQPGPPVASIGTFGQRGQGINADASMYRGGDFAGAGMGDAFGGAPAGDVQFGGNLADWSQNPFSPMDFNATMYDGWNPASELTPQEWSSRMTQPGDYVPLSYGLNGEVSGGYYRGGGIGSDAGATGGRWDLAQQIYNGGGIGSDAARSPTDYGSSSYPYNGVNRAPQNFTPPMPSGSPFQGPAGWPYGPAGGGWGFGRQGSVSDPGQNVDLGFGQFQPGAGGGNFDPQNPGGSGLGYGYGGFPGSLGNDLGQGGNYDPTGALNNIWMVPQGGG